MYGVSPRAMIEKLARVPPENTSRRDKRGLPRKRACSEVRSIPAAGMWATSLKTTNANAVMIIFFRIGGDLKLRAKKAKISSSIV